jgi:hypothetical protein
MSKTLHFFSLVILAVSAGAAAQENAVVEIKDIYPRDLEISGFSLSEDQNVKIEAVGAGGYRDELIASAWILDSQSRKVVWSLDQANPSRLSRELYEANESVKLAKGSYEAYYSFYPNYYYSDGHRGFGDVLGHLWNELFEKDYSRSRAEYRDLKFIVRGKGERLSREKVEQLQKRFGEDAIVSLNGLWDDRYERQGFTLEQPMDLRIYAIGEANRDEEYDYGWIVNTKTREKVWTFKYRDSDPAGGARKNRMVDEVISLPAGTYAAFFVTDDSHSDGKWNSPPPYDPAYWGMTIRVKDASKKQYAKTYDYQDAAAKNTIVELTRLRDDDMRSQGFTLKKPMNVRIYAIGEGRDGEMFDYGWIVNAKTHQKVWEMDYYKTDHAGGAGKNRLFDGTLKLDKGSYLAYFVTDGSHSFMDWNSSRPYDAEHWGLSIYGEDADFNSSDVGKYEEGEDKSVLARLVNIRDDDRRRVRFKLDKDTAVRIYALGEGSDGDMHDYGWIEDDRTGKTVWEMTYRRTEHAGGARKNRMANEIITLKAGEYTVFYESDGSHCFNDWNDDPPYEPYNWGITVYAAEKQ